MVTLHEVITFLVSMQISIKIGRAVQQGMPRPISYAVFCLKKKSGSAGMPRPSSYAVFCLKKKNNETLAAIVHACEREPIAFHWHTDDVLLLDSVRVVRVK